ncbi:MAG: hypothetical protein ACRENL_08445 [Candidatus Dormibacteria bacterium]
MAPVRVRRRRPRRGLRARAAALVLGAAIGCGAVGLTLLAIPPPVGVSLIGDSLEVGSMSLREIGPIAGSRAILYGGAASYVLDERGDGSAVASASWSAAGRISSGVCHLRPEAARLIDECVFTGRSGRLTSIDVLTPSAGPDWQRTYADGARATIAVAPDGAAVPVPFPIAH